SSSRLHVDRVTTPETVLSDSDSATSEAPLASCATVSRSSQVCAATNENITTIAPIVRNLAAGSKYAPTFRSGSDYLSIYETWSVLSADAGIMSWYEPRVESNFGAAG